MGKAIGKIALGAAIIGASFIPGIGPAISTALFSLGAGTALSGAATLAGIGPKAPSNVTPALDRLATTFVPSAPRKAVYGYGAMGNDGRYVEPSGTNQEYIDYIIVVAAHLVTSITGIYFDDLLAWSSSDGVLGQYVGYLTVETRLEGTASNAITINSGTRWNASNRRLTGCAYVHIRIKRTGNSKKAESPLAGGLPSRVTITGAGMPVYDPRYDSTVAGGVGPQRANDQSTWAYLNDGRAAGANPALQILTQLLGWRINGKLSTGYGLPPERIDLMSFAVAANLCDESVARADGSLIPRYLGGGVISEADDPQSVLSALCTACNGRLRDGGGKLSLVIMHNDLAVAAVDDGLGDDHVLSEFVWSPDEALDQSYNIVRGRYCDPSANSLYQLVDYPEVALPPVDGIDRILTLDLPWVDDPSRAQRIAKQVLQRRQYPGSFSAVFSAEAWRYRVGAPLPFTFSALGFDRKLFRIAEQELGERGGTCRMLLTVEHPAIYAWDKEESPAVQAAEPIRYDPLNNPVILGIDQASETALWTGVVDDGGKPDDYADVTIDHTAGNTLYVGPTPAEEVAAAVAQVTTITGTGPGSISYEIEGVRADLEADIAAGNAVQDAALEVVRARIRKGSPNLLPGGDFYDGLNGWGQSGTGWGVVTDTYRGPFAGNFGGGVGAQLFRDIPAAAGVAYSLSAEMDLEGGSDANVYLQFFTATGAYIANGPAVAPDDWNRASSAPTVSPINTGKIRVIVERRATGGPILVTRIQVQEGAATDFDPWANLAETAASITESKEAIAGLSGAFAAYQVTVGARFDANEGTVDDLTEVVANNDLAATQKITRLNSYVRAAPNMLRNSDFKAGLADWVVGGGSWGAGATTAAGSFAVLNPSGAGSVVYQDVELGGETNISFSFEASVGLAVNVQFRNSGGVVSETVAYAGTGARVESAVHRSPVGTTSARLTVFNPANSTTYPSVTRIMLQPGPPSAWNDSADVRELRAEATIAAATLASLDGRVQSYVQLTSISGTEYAAITVATADGPMPYSRIVFQADQFLFDGDVVISGSLNREKMNVSTFVAYGTDTDPGTYARTSPGTTPVSGLNVSVPGVGPRGSLRIRFRCNVSLSNAGGGSTSVFDSYVRLVITVPGPGTVIFDLPVAPVTGVQVVQYADEIDLDHDVAGDISISAEVIRGDTWIVDGEPGIPDARSVNISASNFDVSAKWRWI